VSFADDTAEGLALRVTADAIQRNSTRLHLASVIEDNSERISY
jgi:hypothetical protein